MSEWTRTLLLAAVMALSSHLLIRLGWLSFEGFVIYNTCVLAAWMLRRTP